ncbi:putative immune-responsive protein, partial [Pleomassaria siparia CBS 279.74]
MASPRTSPTDPDGPTGRLCTWIESLILADIPEDMQTRAKHLILDGLACGLIGAHLPWSETAANAVLDMEGEGECAVWGWEKVNIPPLPAALLNSTFLQGFELDDWHDVAPLHSNAILLPALFSAIKHQRQRQHQHQHQGTSSAVPITGNALIVATIAGYETGPRIGRALNGAHMLSMGWHSGAVFGPPTAAASVCKLLSLPAATMEDALGIACTQAGGLMSAQFESEVKRMQHGFAARNGLFAALLAEGGYVGIKRVLEREYGGYLSCFSLGSGKSPPYQADEVSKGLGETWQMQGIRVKQHACMAGIHCVIECVQALQDEHPHRMKHPKRIAKVQVHVGEANFHHGGWQARRPLTVTGAQMSTTYCAATQLVDGQVLPEQFSASNLERDDVWAVQGKIECKRDEAYDGTYKARVTVEFDDGEKLVKELDGPKTVTKGVENKDIVEKWRAMTKGVIDDERRARIEDVVLNLDKVDDVTELADLLEKTTVSPIA